MSTPAADIEHLDQLWRLRHQPDAIHELETLARADLGESATSDYALLWRAARAFHFRAMQCDDTEGNQNNKSAAQYFSQGAAAARAAMEKDKTGIEGCFWRGVNEIEAARHTSTLAALAALKKATALIERAGNIDETYHFAGPLRVMGRIVHRRPLLLGGSANVAIDYFRRALQICPENSTTQIYLAEALLTEQQKPEARRILNEIISAPDDKNWLWEQARDRKLAEQLLQTF
jgi:tetratricopeptide (TPR) repeat protein